MTQAHDMNPASRHRLIAVGVVLAAAYGCWEQRAASPADENDSPAPKGSLSAPLQAVEESLARRSTEETAVRMVGQIPVPLRAAVTLEDGDTVSLTITQTVDQLRAFYLRRGYKVLDHPEGFAIFVTENGPIIQVLKGVGPRSDIVIIQKLTRESETPSPEPSPRPTPELLRELEKRLRSDEPTENLPQPPVWER